MIYPEFINYVKENCKYEALYKDHAGETILVIPLIEAYWMTKYAQPVLNRAVHDVLELNARAMNCMQSEGIVTLADLIRKMISNETWIKTIPNMGKKTEQLILDELARVGFPINPRDGENNGPTT